MHNKCVSHTYGGSARDKGDRKIQGILTTCTDPGRTRSQKGVAKDALLRHKATSGLDYQRLACIVEVTRNKTKNENRHNVVLEA
jgi:hypothetical protein